MRKLRSVKRKALSAKHCNADIATLLLYYHQIRIKVFEGRQLSGGNIHPVVRVSVADQDKDTKIKKCTNNPAFNEVSYPKFFFGLS